MAHRVTLLAHPARHFWPDKPAAEADDFEVDWTARLGGDAIATSRFELPPGAPLAEQASNQAAVAAVRMSGGAPGVYEIVNCVTTERGRALEQAIRLRVK